jgi:hypothetical protein
MKTHHRPPSTYLTGTAVPRGETDKAVFMSFEIDGTYYNERAVPKSQLSADTLATLEDTDAGESIDVEINEWWIDQQ